MRSLSLPLSLLALVLACVCAAPAAARDFAPVDRPGPPLTPSAAQLRSSVSCDDGAATSAKPPVLLTAGTEINTQQDFGWNHTPALRAGGWPVCTVEQAGWAGFNVGDIQTRAEYVVNAIRYAYAAGGNRRIAIVGHSQGGQVMRWALRFWPDTRAMVSDVVGFAPTNHGSVLVPALCVPDCAPALWQQRATSDYVRALNSGQETFAGISYTNVYTHTDQFVQPNLDDTGTSSLRTGDGRIANVALQDICPASVAEHLLIGTADPVAWALEVDALTHDGPADPQRVDRAVCDQSLMPGVERSRFAQDFGDATAAVAAHLAVAPRVPAEPALKPYVFADYAGPLQAPPAAGTCTTSSRTVRLPKGVRSVRLGDRTLRVRNGRVTVRFSGRQTRLTLRLVLADGRTRTLVVRRC